jgi:phosphoribosylformylglycinamidine cyclo-ligase
VPRVLPDSTCAHLDRKGWTRPPVFDWLQQEGGVIDAEMHRVFNCGIGMVVIVSPADSAAAMRLLRESGETVSEIGRIEPRRDGAPQTVVS